MLLSTYFPYRADCHQSPNLTKLMLKIQIAGVTQNCYTDCRDKSIAGFINGVIFSRLTFVRCIEQERRKLCKADYHLQCGKMNLKVETPHPPGRVPLQDARPSCCTGVSRSCNSVSQTGRCIPGSMRSARSCSGFRC